MTPFTDRAGRFSPLKTATVILCALPLFGIGAQAILGQLGPRPFTEAIHQAGDWALRFLLLTLAVTPARHLYGQTRLLLLRRVIGLSALGYALLHFGLYIIDLKLDLVRVASEIALRFYLTIGFVSVAILAVLGATSFDRALKRLGAERWRRLHGLVHPALVLGLVHLALHLKFDVSEAVLLAGFYLFLLGVRGLVKRRVALSVAVLAGLAVGAGLGALGLELAWYGLVRGVPVVPLLAYQTEVAFGVAPAHQVVLAGLGVALSTLAVRGLAVWRGREPRLPARAR